LLKLHAEWLWNGFWNYYNHLLQISLDIKYWPNPSKSYFNIKLETNNYSNNVKIQVYDVNGRLLHSDVFAPQDEYKFGRDLSVGVYIVKISQAENIQLIRIIKY